MMGDRRGWDHSVPWTQVGISIALSATMITCANAAPISVHDRGPCPNAADGVCIPNRRNFGFYSTKWRPWPGDRPVAVEEDGVPGPGAAPPDVSPFELPQPEQEERFGRPGRSPVGPSPVPPTGPSADQLQDGDLPPSPPLDSEDAPPAPPAPLRDDARPAPPTATPPQVPLPETPSLPGAAARPPLGASLPTGTTGPGRQSRQTGGQAPHSGLVWKPISPQSNAAVKDAGLPLSSGGDRNPASNPLRAPGRPTISARADKPAHTTGAVRQVAYAVITPATSTASQDRLRPNPLRP